MSTEDVHPDSAPVLADDKAVERLRQAVITDAVVWGDDEPEDDPAFAMLGALLHDVTLDRADRRLADVIPLRRRRALVRGGAVAACALGLLSVGGVAAASPGSPLYAVRTAVSSAVTSVVDVVSRPAPAAAVRRLNTATSARPAPSPDRTPARSLEAARLVAALLDRAQAQLDAGHSTPARALLDAAERHLTDVAPEDGRAALVTRLGVLRLGLPASTPAPRRSGPATPGPLPTSDQAGRRGSGDNAGERQGKGTSGGATTGDGNHGGDGTTGGTTRDGTTGGDRSQGGSGTTDGGKTDDGKTDGKAGGGKTDGNAGGGASGDGTTGGERNRGGANGGSPISSDRTNSGEQASDQPTAQHS